MRRYLDLFVSESREHIGAASRLHDALSSDPSDVQPWREFMRHAHSLKGMAAAMRYEQMVELAHAMEDIAERLQLAPPGDPAPLLPLLGLGLGCLDAMVDQAEQGDEPHSSRSHDVIGQLARALDESLPLDRLPGAAQRPDRAELDPTGVEPPMAPDAVDEIRATRWRLELRLDRSAESTAGRTVCVLRHLQSVGRVTQVDPPSLDATSGTFGGRLSLAFETTVERESLSTWIARIDGVEQVEVLPDAGAVRPGPSPGAERTSWIRVRADAFDSLVERVLELKLEQSRLQGSLAPHAPLSRRHLARSQLMLRTLHTELIELRLVPFDTVAHRLRQSVRQLAGELGKDVTFEIEGADVRVDRAVLDAVLDSLMHMVRNAIDHGLELPNERLALGKPRHGRLRLALRRVGDRVRLGLSDDGRGICAEHLRRTAVDLGLVDPETVEAMTDSEALLLTTLPRLSTARQVSRISGRGVGLDVVRDQVESLGGALELRSRPGSGTEIVLLLPLTLASIRGITVHAGGEVFALPASSILRAVAVETIAPGTLTVDLALALGVTRDEDRTAPAWGLELRHVAIPTVLLVDSIEGRREILIQPLQPPLSAIQHFSGAALLDDGTITIVVDPLPLADEAAQRAPSTDASAGTTMRR